MKQLLSEFLGKTVGINCGGSGSIEGKILDIVEGVIKLKDDEEMVLFIPIDKVHFFWEVREKEKTVGFVPKPAVKEQHKKS